jgi:hypothetical protein
MCGINRITAEPPSHKDCAEYALKACPFLSNPQAKRPERPMPAGVHVAGHMIERNPGVSLMWTAESFALWRLAGHQTPLIRLGPPLELAFWANGREATREELMRSLMAGLELLRGADPEPEAQLAIDRDLERFLALLPPHLQAETRDREELKRWPMRSPSPPMMA